MRPLTPKQLSFCQHYIATRGDAPEAALKAYHCSNRNSARVMACKALKKPQVRHAIRSALSNRGLLEAASRTLKESMTATKMVRVIGKGSVERPDWKVRLNAVSRYFKMLFGG